jgi:DNA-binding response OmpR family regulator
VLRIGSLCIDRRTGEATRDGQSLDLQQTPARILLALAEAWPRTLTRSELVERLWGDDPPQSDPLRSHLYLLRQVLDKPFPVSMLKTVHGVGFRLQADA